MTRALPAGVQRSEFRVPGWLDLISTKGSLAAEPSEDFEP